MSTPSRPSLRFAPPRLSLGGCAASTGAKLLHGHLRDQIVLPALTEQQRRPSSLPAIERALEGLTAGLALAMVNGDGWLRRPMSEASFTAEPGVSRGQFLKVYRALDAGGLIETAPGFLDRSGLVPRGAETRLRLSETGRSLLSSFGIVLADVSKHYVSRSGAEGKDLR